MKTESVIEKVIETTNEMIQQQNTLYYIEMAEFFNALEGNE